MKKLIAFAVAAAVVASMSGCATYMNPTMSDVSQANYGPPVERDLAMRQAHAAMDVVLKDPESARWACADDVQTSWVHDLFTPKSSTFYGWGLSCSINAKNSYGGYTGAHDYQFFFRGDTLERVYSYKDNIHDAMHMRRVI